jgi:hypothetical protein
VLVYAFCFSREKAVRSMLSRIVHIDAYRFS